MRLALISPNHGRRHILDLRYLRDVFLGASASTCMPLVLPLLASLTPQDIDLTLIDETTDPIDFDAEVDAVAITAITPCAPRAYAIADAFRARSVPVVIGGLHASLFPEEAQAHADAVCIGEAEAIWPAVLRDLRDDRLQPVYRAEGGADLGVYIPPRWDRIPARRYRFFSIQASRGCRYDCDFCTVRAMYGTTRFKPIPHLVREIAVVREQTRAWSDRFLLVDDNVFSDRAYAKALLEALAPMGLAWECFAPLRIADDGEMLDLLRRSGCTRLSIGIESISPESLADVHKKGVNRVDRYRRQIARLHAHGLPIVGLFILGFDGDDEGIFRRTRDFVQETAIAFPVFSILTPGPGTRLYERLEQEGRMRHRRWAEFDGTHVCFEPKQMSAATLADGYRWLYRELFTPPAIGHRVEALWSEGVIRGERRRVTRWMVRAILRRELVRQRRRRPTLRPQLRQALADLRTKPDVDIVTVLLNLGLAEYVDQMPLPERAF